MVKYNIRPIETPATDRLRARLIEHIKITGTNIQRVANAIGFNRTTISAFVNDRNGISYERGVIIRNYLREKESEMCVDAAKAKAIEA
jgi:plasmid maintenance system antidote protein VapI